MNRTFLKSKIHRATITDVQPHYEGSLGLASDLMRAANILPYEQVQVYNINNGERFETYAIEEPAGSGTIALKGAAARKGALGDVIIIACYTAMDDKEFAKIKPSVIILKESNAIKEEVKS